MVDNSVILRLLCKLQWLQYFTHISLCFVDYENELQTTETGTLVACETVSEFRPDDEWDKACRFDISLMLGEDCVKQQSFGYEDGQPCVLLKLNRVCRHLTLCFTQEIKLFPDVLKSINCMKYGNKMCYKLSSWYEVLIWCLCFTLFFSS